MALLEGDDMELLQPRRFTPGEFWRLVEHGTFAEDEHVELLEGVIVSMSPQGTAHTRITARLNHALVKAAPPHTLVQVQSSLPLVTGAVPEPDLALVPARDLDRPGNEPRHPSLLVEVADTSLKRDRLKATLYARAGIPEYWLVNIPEQAVEVFTQPDPDAGRYQAIHVLGERATLASPALPELRLPVAELFSGSH
jgi:Uma2 family endonuclease